MYLVSIYERDKSLNFQTLDSLNDMFRGLCNGLDVNKFNSYSNFNLFICSCNISDNIDCLLSDFNHVDENEDSGFHQYSFYEPTNENLADSVYDYMTKNINVYYDIVKQIDDFREKINKYKLDK